MSPRRSTKPTAVIAHPGAELYGSDRVMLETISGLVERGWSVVLATPVDGPLLSEARSRGATSLVVPVPVLRKGALTPLGLVMLGVEAVVALMRCGRLLRRIRPDVIYVSTVTLPTWLVSAQLARVPAIAHLHEAERRVSPLLQTALALPLTLANRVVANSRFSLATVVRRIPALNGKSVVIYNGVPGPAAVIAARDTIADDLRVLYLGRISERKGVGVAVEAVAALNRAGFGATLDIVGAVFPGYEDFERRLRERVGELGMAKRITFRGFQPSVWDSLEGADVAVVPSVVDEPFGNTAVEAVLAARPVVVSRSGGLPEAVAGFASASVVSPDAVEELADALRAVGTAWDRLRRQALTDAEAAAARFAPSRYRDEIASEIIATSSGTRSPR